MEASKESVLRKFVLCIIHTSTVPIFIFFSFYLFYGNHNTNKIQQINRCYCWDWNGQSLSFSMVRILDLYIWDMLSSKTVKFWYQCGYPETLTLFQSDKRWNSGYHYGGRHFPLAVHKSSPGCFVSMPKHYLRPPYHFSWRFPW